MLFTSLFPEFTDQEMILGICGQTSFIVFTARQVLLDESFWTGSRMRESYRICGGIDLLDSQPNKRSLQDL